MKRRIILIVAALAASIAPAAAQQAETIYISDLYTTHIVFDTEIKYGDLSNTADIIGSVVESSRNLMALIAAHPFERPASVTVLESNGHIHTFLLRYEETPEKLVIDKRYGTSGNTPVPAQGGSAVNSLWQTDAPPLRDVLAYPQGLHHLAVTDSRVTLMCENIFSYSDITYIVFSLDNRSGVSFEVSDATFRIEPRDKKKRKLVTSTNIIPQNKVGSLTAAPGAKGRVAYALDKLSLSEDQVLAVDVYEHGGQRHFEMSMSSQDINLAQPPAGK